MRPLVLVILVVPDPERIPVAPVVPLLLCGFVPLPLYRPLVLLLVPVPLMRAFVLTG